MDSPSSTSLRVPYVPSKFSSSIHTRASNGHLRKRPRRDDTDIAPLRRGGGISAFRPGSQRIPQEEDEDEHNIPLELVQVKPVKRPNQRRKRKRWNRFKWALVIANTALTLYALAGLAVCIATLLGVLPDSPIILAANPTPLHLSTAAAGFLLLTALIGWPGILTNHRPFLAIYTALLLPGLALAAAPGYLTYKRANFNLPAKLDAQWSAGLGARGRLALQDAMKCCGYFSPFVEATAGGACYARSVLPGCKAPFLQAQRRILEAWYTVAFAVCGAQVLVLATAVLCANHVTYRFGKGMMPERYRLDERKLAVIVQEGSSTHGFQDTRPRGDKPSPASSEAYMLDTIPDLSYKTPRSDHRPSRPTLRRDLSGSDLQYSPSSDPSYPATANAHHAQYPPTADLYRASHMTRSMYS
ncbi:hypothetical protein K525DRAFT_242465, partial [Schizophyllum commune Loenen D]